MIFDLEGITPIYRLFRVNGRVSFQNKDAPVTTTAASTRRLAECTASAAVVCAADAVGCTPADAVVCPAACVAKDAVVCAAGAVGCTPADAVVCSAACTAADAVVCAIDAVGCTPADAVVCLAAGAFSLPQADRVLRAKHIFVRAGEFLVGSKEFPYLGKLTIELHGEKDAKAIVYDNAIEAGNKLIANINVMKIYGK